METLNMTLCTISQHYKSSQNTTSSRSTTLQKFESTQQQHSVHDFNWNDDNNNDNSSNKNNNRDYNTESLIATTSQKFDEKQLDNTATIIPEFQHLHDNNSGFLQKSTSTCLGKTSMTLTTPEFWKMPLWQQQFWFTVTTTTTHTTTTIEKLQIL